MGQRPGRRVVPTFRKLSWAGGSVEIASWRRKRRRKSARIRRFSAGTRPWTVAGKYLRRDSAPVLSHLSGASLPFRVLTFINAQYKRTNADIYGGREREKERTNTRSYTGRRGRADTKPDAAGSILRKIARLFIRHNRIPDYFRMRYRRWEKRISGLVLSIFVRNYCGGVFFSLI